jgi:hypothetical protein
MTKQQRGNTKLTKNQLVWVGGSLCSTKQNTTPNSLGYPMGNR